MSTTTQTLKEDLESLQASVDEDLAALHEYKGLLLKAEALQTRALQTAKAHSKEAGKLGERVAALKKAAKGDSAAETAALSERLARLKADLHEVGFMEPRTGSLFVRLFLGRVNVKVALERDRLRLREEYDKFKRRTNILFLIIPLALMLVAHEEVTSWVKYTNWVPIVSQVWLLYYYVSLALRENILQVNGSKIMTWWIVHHYVSAFMSVILLTWPDSPTYRSLLRPFSYYFMLQGILQLLQSWYQQSRHYALVSTGRTSRIDPSHSEGLREAQTGFWVLVVLLVGTYIAQLYMGYLLLAVAQTELNLSQPWYEYREEVQAVSLALCFVILACANFVALLTTLWRKHNRRSKRARQ